MNYPNFVLLVVPRDERNPNLQLWGDYQSFFSIHLCALWLPHSISAFTLLLCYASSCKSFTFDLLLSCFSRILIFPRSDHHFLADQHVLILSFLHYFPFCTSNFVLSLHTPLHQPPSSCLKPTRNLKKEMKLTASADHISLQIENRLHIKISLFRTSLIQLCFSCWALPTLDFCGWFIMRKLISF